jgi:Fe-Mn family superoxide dismutase
VALFSQPVSAADPAKPSAPGKRAPVPLPFDHKKLEGLSERLIVSHHENIAWDAVQRRYEKATRAAAALRA